MSQVHISSGAHTVTVTHDGTDLGYVIDKAQALYAATYPEQPREVASAGFAMQLSDGLRREGAASLYLGEQPVVLP